MERENRLSGVLALFTCLTIPLMLCVAVFVFFGGGAVGNPLAALGIAPSRSEPRLVAIGGDGNVFLMDRGGANKVSITSDAALQPSANVRKAYAFPNWSRDSQRVAFVGVTSENDGTAILYTASVKDVKPVQVFRSESDFPFYLSWSPDSKRIAFLAQADQDLSLNFASADGSETKTLDTGSPFYFSWSPDSQSLITHVGGSRRQSADAFIGLQPLGSSDSVKHLAIAPASFLAPAWSPSGQDVLTALMGSGGANDTLVISDAQGENQRSLLTFNGNIAFSWSPDGKNIAYLNTQGGGARTKSELRSLKPDGSNDRLLSDESPIAFFWSPDSARIAYLVRAQGEQGELQAVRAGQQQNALHLTWKVLSIADNNVFALGTFIPSDAFTSLLPYFDQYAQSIRIWSPDSRSLVYAAVEEDDSDAIYVVNATGGEAPHRIANGAIAVWSWD
jgi:TolB protein